MDTNLTEITVIGDDSTGILAEVTTLLFNKEINIEDLDQSAREELFQMTMHVNTSEMSCSPVKLQRDLDDLCDDLGLDVQIRFPSTDDTPSLAVLVTKESHCLEKLLEASANGDLTAEISVVVGNHSDLRPLAEQHGVPFHDIGNEKGTPDEDELIELLDEYDVDLIALARYIRILGPEVVFRYQNRIINVHPSLLPAFPGAAAYRQALEEGVRIAGVTAHYVTPDLDQGPILTQRAFNVPDRATEQELKRRGQPLEAEALLEAVQVHLNNDPIVSKGRTYVRGDNAQLGLPEEADQLNPSKPMDEALDQTQEVNLAAQSAE